MEVLFDVVVVGAGLSGLVCALELQQLGKRVCVIEARSRCGGRIEGAPVPGIELGGMWINTQAQTCVTALCQKFALEVVRQNSEGRKMVVDCDGRVLFFTGRIPNLSWSVLADASLASFLLDIQSIAVPSNAIARDTSLEQWAHWHCWTAQARRLIDVAGQLMFGWAAKNVPFAWACDFVVSNGGMSTLTEGDDGHQRERLVRGTSALVASLTDSLIHPPVFDAVAVSCKDDASSHITITCKDGRSFRASEAIVMAIPQHVAAQQMEFEPPLPDTRVSLTNHFRLGHWSKVVLVFLEPWWRNRGLNGECLFLDPCPVAMVVDTCSTIGVNSLTALITADAGEKWAKLSEKARVDAVVQQLSGVFGEDVTRFTKYFIKVWSSDPFTGGCPVTVPDENIPSDWLHQLQQPHGRVHFSSTDVADSFRGYMEGACRRGYDVAHDIAGVKRAGLRPPQILTVWFVLLFCVVVVALVTWFIWRR